MRLTATLGLVLSIVPVGLLGVFLASSGSPFQSLTALALGVLLVLVLQVVLLTRDSRSAPLDLLVVGVVFGFFLARLAVLWLAPELFIYPGVEFEPADVVRSLGFLTVGTIAAVAGFRCGVGWRPWKRRRPAGDAAPVLRMSMGRLLVIGIVYVGIEVLLWIYLGTASVALSPDAPGGGLLFLRHFVSLYAAIGIGLVAGLDRWRQFGVVSRGELCALVGLFIAYTIAGGSRSGLLTLAIIVTIYLLIRHGNFRLSPRLLAIAGGAFVLSVLFFPAATIVRFAWASAFEPEGAGFVLDFSRQGTSEAWLVSGALAGLNRLNGLDPLLMIVGRKEVTPVADFVNPAQVVQSGINLLVPAGLVGGDPFPGVLPTSRLFRAVYLGRPAEFIHSWYQTDMWTFWGCAFALGGWLRGSLAMFGIALFLGAGYRRIVKRGGRLSLLWRLWWLYSCYLVIISYGFDVDFAAAVSLLVGGTIVTLLVRPRAVAPAASAALPPFPERPDTPVTAASTS